ncbi:adipocyte plasma membrane-associated protein [Python bivittatus]|uniref:Adipocyte plasma membrane-associated protein n=1 Tax=Python bivittatus TaxID=176946 RepID=A0A9F2R5H6_PYTBI|nr:adipocyte plasma membrane-associated protein [Python bivittatus]
MNEAEGLRQRRPARPQVITEENTAQGTKDSSTYSNRVFRVTFMTLAVSLIIPLFGAIMFLDCPIDPLPISFKEPPLLTGALEPNVKLQQAERLFENQLVGPESIANIGDVLFTGTADGKILKIENGEIRTLARLGHGPCGTREDEPTCGRPLGIHVGPNNTLFVVDAYYGLFEINPISGKCISFPFSFFLSLSHTHIALTHRCSISVVNFKSFNIGSSYAYGFNYGLNGKP